MAFCHTKDYDDHWLNATSKRNNYKHVRRQLTIVDEDKLSDTLVFDGVSRRSSSKSRVSGSYSSSSERLGASRSSSAGSRDQEKTSRILRREQVLAAVFEPVVAGGWKNGVLLHNPKSSDEIEDTTSKPSDEGYRRRDTRRRSHQRGWPRNATSSEHRPQDKDLIDRVSEKLAECSVRRVAQPKISRRRRDERGEFYGSHRRSPYRSSGGGSSLNHCSRRDKSDPEFRRKYYSRSPSPTRHSYKHGRMENVSRELYRRHHDGERSRQHGSSPRWIRIMSFRRKLSELLPECRLRDIEATGGRRNFGKWFQALPPNVKVDKDLRTDRGIFKKDNFQTAEALDRYLGIYH